MPSLARRAGFRRGLLIALAGMVCALPCGAAEGPRAFPLWDGKETVESYAARVGMAATKSIDLGGGVKLDLVLIPAGEFIMGSAEPPKPTVTVADAAPFIWIGGGAAAVLLLLLIAKCIKKREFSFSLRWLLLMTIATGLCAGGIARRMLALKEAALYEMEVAEFKRKQGDESPAHSVTITRPFYMGKYTVTQEQYTTLTGYNPSYFKGAQLPVEMVSWDDATAFCIKLNWLLHDKTLEVRLPTEAQWEYAARAGTRTRFYSGDNDSDVDAVGWSDSNSGGTTHPVGQKKANAFGLYDVHGNVWEWCEDAYMDHYEEMKTIDPVNEKGTSRVLRGGSFYHNPEACRVSIRIYTVPGNRASYLGFRVAVVPSSKNL